MGAVDFFLIQRPSTDIDTTTLNRGKKFTLAELDFETLLQLGVAVQRFN